MFVTRVAHTAKTSQRPKSIGPRKESTYLLVPSGVQFWKPSCLATDQIVEVEGFVIFVVKRKQAESRGWPSDHAVGGWDGICKKVWLVDENSLIGNDALRY